MDVKSIAIAALVSLGAACRAAPTAPEPAPVARNATAEGPTAKDPVVKDDAANVRVRAEGQLGPGNNTLFIDIAAPAGAKLTLDSPVSVRGSGGIGLSFPRRLGGTLGENSMPLRFPIHVEDGATGPAQVDVSYYWCTEGNEAACQRERALLDVELDLTGASAGGEAHLSYRARGDKS